MIEAAEIVCPEKLQSFRDSSNRISQLQNISTKFLFLSFAIAENSTTRDVGQDTVFIHGCNKNMRIDEEFLEDITYLRITIGECIFGAAWSSLKMRKLQSKDLRL